MGEIWYSVGFIRYPLVLSFLAVAGLALWSATRLFGQNARADGLTKAWVDAILFWGGFAVIAGVLGTLVGIVIAAQAIEAVGEVSTTLVWGGIKVALLSSILGMLILGLAALAWFGLQLRWKVLTQAHPQSGL